MAVYNVNISFFNNTQMSIVNNTNDEISYFYNTDYQVIPLRDNIPGNGGFFANSLNGIYNLILFTKTNVIFTFTREFSVSGSNSFFMEYIDSNGKLVKVFRVGTPFPENQTITGLSDSVSPGGLTSLHIDDTRLEQINYNNKSYTTFPVDIPLEPNVKTMTVIGKTFNVQLDNELNITRVKDGQTEYRQFPATVMVGENKTLQLYGKEDPEITIDYTGTQDPVISNTPVTPPPVV